MNEWEMMRLYMAGVFADQNFNAFIWFEIYLSWFSTMAYSNCHYSWTMPHVAQSKFQPFDMLNSKHTVTVQPNMISHQSNLTSNLFIQFDFELLNQENSGHELLYCEYFLDINFFWGFRWIKIWSVRNTKSWQIWSIDHHNERIN